MVFFFYGPNSFASRRKLQEMVATFVQKTGSDIGLERISGPQTDIRSLASALQATPFLSSSRLVIIEYLSQNKSAAEKVAQLLKQIPNTTVAVFYESDVDGRTTYFKTMSSLPNAVKFEPLPLSQLQAWVKREVQRLGGAIDKPTLDLLLEFASDDQWRLEQELVKLVNYRPQISAETVRELVVPNQNLDIFNLVESMSSGKTAAAIKAFHGLLSDQANEVYILSMIIWQLRNLLLAKTAGNMTSAELAKKAGMSPYVATKALDRQRGFAEETLRQSFQAAIETDYKIKTGQGEPVHLVENLIYHLSSRS